MIKRLLIVLAAAALLRLPFLYQAIQGDDIYYLNGARHGQIDPAHPNHARYMYIGEMVSMQGHSHPPLNIFVLSGLLGALKDVREVPFHLAYAAFSLIAAIAMWRLAERFSSRPLEAAMLFLVTPAFVINGNSLEADLPLLAFWMASCALFIEAVDRRPLLLLPAALAMALTAMAAYQAAILIPILGLYLWQYRRGWVLGWIVLATPLATLLAWQAFERSSGAEMPVKVLTGYFSSHGFQSAANKVRNLLALTAHLAWVVSPLLILLAFVRGVPHKRAWAALAILFALADWNPLYWVSALFGAIVIWRTAEAWRERKADAGELFLHGWTAIFFAAAVIGAFAGSARYLLPLAAPLAILISRKLAPKWLWIGIGAHAVFSIALAVVNYQHWDGYRQFARQIARQAENKRLWINGEWGMRFYLEEIGGQSLLTGQGVRPGDIVVSSRLALPIQFHTGGGVLATIAEQDIRTRIPLRIAGIGSKSGYSTSGFGLRPFDIQVRAPLDIVKAETVVERQPVREFLPMNAPDAESHIVSGVYSLENEARWMGAKAVFILKPPAQGRVSAKFFIPDSVPGRIVSLEVDGQSAAQRTFDKPGLYTLESPPLTSGKSSAMVTITIDKTTRAAGDNRDLGMVLAEIGFKK